MTDTIANNKFCPLCGESNHCAMAAGEQATACWCQSVTIDEAILQQIPQSQRGIRCVCQQCIKALKPLTKDAS